MPSCKYSRFVFLLPGFLSMKGLQDWHPSNTEKVRIRMVAFLRQTRVGSIAAPFILGPDDCGEASNRYSTKGEKPTSKETNPQKCGRASAPAAYPQPPEKWGSYNYQLPSAADPVPTSLCTIRTLRASRKRGRLYSPSFCLHLARIVWNPARISHSRVSCSCPFLLLLLLLLFLLFFRSYCSSCFFCFLLTLSLRCDSVEKTPLSRDSREITLL